jgi:hypothetical protein
MHGFQTPNSRKTQKYNEEGYKIQTARYLFLRREDVELH